MRNLLILATTIVSTALPTLAATKNYVVGSGSTVDAYNDIPSDNGLEIHTQLAGSLNGHAFSLDDNQTETFAFFNIWTPESHVHTDGGEDTQNKTITATLDFSVPDLDAVITGVTFGGYFSIYIDGIGDLPFGQVGKVEWDGPVIIVSGDRTFEVSLNDAEFNSGLFGLNTSGEPRGSAFGATISATVRQITSTGVPDGGATAALLGGSLAGMTFVRRLRRS